MNRRNFAQTMMGAVAGWAISPQIAKAIAPAAAPIIPSAAPSFLPVIGGGRYFSPLVGTEFLQEGCGFNFTEVLPETPPTGAVSACTLHSWSMQSQLIQSEDIPMEPKDFQEEQDRKFKSSNLQRTTEDIWDEKDLEEYGKLCGNEFSCSGLGFYASKKRIPTSRLTQSHLDVAYNNLILDGAGENPIATCDGAPQLLLLCDMKAHRDLIKEDGVIGVPFKDGNEKICAHLHANNLDRCHGGFIHFPMVKLPRYVIKKKKMERAPYYITDPESRAQLVNPDYINAPIGQAFIYHPDVMRRVHAPTLKEDESIYGVTALQPKILMDEEGKPLPPDQQPENVGNLMVHMMAGWKPVYPRFGWSIFYRRCL